MMFISSQSAMRTIRYNQLLYKYFAKKEFAKGSQSAMRAIRYNLGIVVYETSLIDTSRNPLCVQ